MLQSPDLHIQDMPEEQDDWVLRPFTVSALTQEPRMIFGSQDIELKAGSCKAWVNLPGRNALLKWQSCSRRTKGGKEG